jgi:hypothetical protein
MLHEIPTIKEARTYKKILSDFREALGIEINHSKSMVYFCNTNIGVQRNLSNIVGFERKNLPNRYMGAPLMNRESKYITWEGILTKLQERAKR